MAARAYDKVFEAMEEFERESPYWEKKKASEIKGELLQLTRAVLKKYTLEDDAKTKYFLAQPSRMLKIEMRQWNSTAFRRMRMQPNGRNPWKISFSWNLPFEVFDVLRIKCKSLSNMVTTKRRCTIIFTSAEEVISLMDHADLDLRAESPQPLSKLLKNKDYAGINCRQDRPFTLQYSYTKELISISFFYGVWNAHGIPQHV